MNELIKEIVKVPNGDSFSKIAIYQCNECGQEFDESHPHTKDHCRDCSLVKGFISEKEYLSCSGVSLPNAHASVIKGKVMIWVGNKAPWDKSDKELRNTLQYREWRESVFVRDNYNCQHCGQRGGELNAHHIKPYAKHKKLRLEIGNGLTLCIDCHRKEHKK